MKRLETYLREKYDDKAEYTREDFVFSENYRNIKAIYYRVYDNKKVFAFIGFPETPPPENGYPAVVLFHGGMGKAYFEWVKIWTERGYAAIAPDFNAQYADSHTNRTEKNKYGGPKGYGSTLVEDMKDADPWIYFSVLSAKKALDVLLDSGCGKINANRIFAEGISWGGATALIFAAEETRLRALSVKYTSAFIADSRWGKEDMSLNKLTEKELRQYNNFFDPRTYLKKIHIPVLLAAGADDPCFTVKNRKKTSDLLGGTVRFSYRTRFCHGQNEGSEGGESGLFFDFVCGKQKFPKPVCFAQADTLQIYEAENLVKKTLAFTYDNPKDTERCDWEEKLFEDDEVELPPLAQAWFIYGKTTDGSICSSDVYFCKTNKRDSNKGEKGDA